MCYCLSDFPNFLKKIKLKTSSIVFLNLKLQFKNYLTLFCFQKCTFDLEQFRLFTILSFCNLQIAICIFSNSQKCALHVFKITSQIWNLTFTGVQLRFDTSKTQSTDFIRSVFWSSVGLLAFLVLNSLRLHILQGTYIHNVFLKSKYRFYTCVSLVPLLSFTHLLVQGDQHAVNDYYQYVCATQLLVSH